jgi:hypothetical protein
LKLLFFLLVTDSYRGSFTPRTLLVSSDFN